MRLVRWKRHTWDLATLPAYEPRLASYFVVREATRDEDKAVRHAIFTAFGLDTAWGDCINQVRNFIDAELTTGILHRNVPSIVITHGPRIIAASALSLAEDAPSHLISGPCVLSEYRNRGLGSALLHASLSHLRDAGLSRATGITKENVPAGKYLYPKWGSTVSDVDFDKLAQS